MDFSRRDLILKALYGTGLLGLRSLATGIPLGFLLNPRKAVAQQPGPTNMNAQYVILSTSGNGAPMNANVPGMYASGTSAIVHPTMSSMAPTTFTLGGQQVTAAAPWASLPASTLQNTCFFHHGTYTVVHPDERNVLKLMGSIFQSEMFPSLLAKQLAPQLGTIQTEPIVLGSETINFDGRAQPNLAPVALSQTLLAPGGALGQLQSLRDKYLAEINAVVRAQGNAAQRACIDRYVISQTQARESSQNLLSTLATLKDNSQDSQATAAVVLIQMNVAPVVTMHIAFGGDNHTDTGLTNESTQTVAGVQTIQNLMTQLTAANLQHRVTFLSLNVFGRTLAEGTNTSLNGRTHHGDHHCAVIIGAPFKGGVIGGVEMNSTTNNDFRAMSLDSTTGAGVPGNVGDVTFANTLTSMAKTVGVGVGADPTYLDTNISGGTVITPALTAA